MKKVPFVALTVGVLIATSGVVYAQTFRLYTLSGFAEELMSRGIIPSPLHEKARSLVRMIERIEDAKDAIPTQTPALNADKTAVTVSQLIEHANGNYEEGKDIEGLLLLVENTSTSTIELEAVRGCQVVYRILAADGAVVYDSGTKEKCTTDERVTYFLNGNQTRMFEVRHRATDYPLPKGAYTFVLEYPGYGGGSRTVTVE